LMTPSDQLIMVTGWLHEILIVGEGSMSSTVISSPCPASGSERV
jgi:hypothetical protein